jgi:hypothetical protein
MEPGSKATGSVGFCGAYIMFVEVADAEASGGAELYGCEY